MKEILLIILLLPTICALDTFYLCEKSYDGIQEDLTIYEMQNEIFEEKNYGITESELNNYIENWTSICSEITKKSLNPELLCKKIYYFIIENKYNYTEEDLKSIEVVDSISTIKYFINNNLEVCFNQGYSDKLPKLPSNILIINQTKIEECDLNVSNFFSSSIPFIHINIGKLSCDKVKKIKYLFSIKKNEQNIVIVGIRIYLIICLVILGFLLKVFKDNSYFNKTFKKLTHRKNYK